MQSSSLLITLALLAISCVNADYSINNPVAGTTWTAGQSATVSWVPAGVGYETAQHPVDVLKGDPSALQYVANVGTVAESDASYTFNVPDTYSSGSDYVVRIGDKYSHQFTVAGGSGSGGNEQSGGSGSGSASGGSGSANTFGGVSGGGGSGSGSASGGSGSGSASGGSGSGSASGGSGSGSASGGSGGGSASGGSGSGSTGGGVSGGINGTTGTPAASLPSTGRLNGSLNGTNNTLNSTLNATSAGAPQFASTASMGALIPVAILALAWN